MLYVVGIGHGDSELLTLKAVRLLGEADAIAFEDPPQRCQSGDKDAPRPHAWQVPGSPLSSQDRRPCLAQEQTRTEAARRLLEILELYPNVVFPVLGDPSEDETAQSLLAQLGGKHPCQVVPGIFRSQT